MVEPVILETALYYFWKKKIRVEYFMLLLSRGKSSSFRPSWRVIKGIPLISFSESKNLSSRISYQTEASGWSPNGTPGFMPFPGSKYCSTRSTLTYAPHQPKRTYFMRLHLETLNSLFSKINACINANLSTIITIQEYREQLVETTFLHRIVRKGHTMKMKMVDTVERRPVEAKPAKVVLIS